MPAILRDGFGERGNILLVEAAGKRPEESVVETDDKRELLRHFLGTLAYRTQKALRDAPEDFGDFEPGNQVRTPRELARHMTSVLGYARTFFDGGRYRPALLPTLGEEIERFHTMLTDLSDRFETSDWPPEVTQEQLLQGPLSDAMTHAGQLAMLRRLQGGPVPPENFVLADVRPSNLGPDQPDPRALDRTWPEKL